MKEKEEYVMVKHIILWTLKDEFSDEEKNTIKQGIKEGLESLPDKYRGLWKFQSARIAWQAQR